MGQEVIFTSSQPMSIIPLDVHKLGNFQYLQFTTVTRKHVPYCLLTQILQIINSPWSRNLFLTQLENQKFKSEVYSPLVIK